MSEPATKQDLEQATTQLRGEMKDLGEQLRGEMKDIGEQLRGEMKDMGEQFRGEVTQLRGDMGDMEARLSLQIDQSASHHANVMVEQLSVLVGGVDDKYKGLPGDYKELRARFDDHVADHHLHVRLPPAPAKRVRRPRSR
jgi:hypothetical protein